VAANLAAAAPGTTAHTRLSWVCDTIAMAFAAPDHASGVVALESWARGHGLPSLGQLGVLPKQRQGIAAAALGASSMQANPVTLTEDDLVSIMAKAG
jgi:alcohol dehydrogenase class IV